MSELIKVTKDGEVIEISPLTLDNHQKQGWVLVEVEPEAVEEKEEDPASAPDVSVETSDVPVEEQPKTAKKKKSKK